MNTIPKKNPGLLVVVMVAIVLFLLFSPLILSGRRNWWQAWLYAIVQILAFIVSRVVAERRNPGIIQERSNYFNQKDTKSWDKITLNVSQKSDLQKYQLLISQNSES